VAVSAIVSVCRYDLYKKDHSAPRRKGKYEESAWLDRAIATSADIAMITERIAVIRTIVSMIINTQYNNCIISKSLPNT
jgi:hypothetical protein